MEKILLTLSILLLSHVSLISKELDKKKYLAEKCNTPIVIDGSFDEPVWSGHWENGFVQREPFENAAPSQQTQFRILFDDENMYVGIKAIDTAPDSIVTRLARRDKMDGDLVGVMFDSYHDLRTAFAFFVSASGVKTDEIFSDDGAVEDLTWDPIWYVKTARQSWGWSAEMKIPLTQLRFDKSSHEVWGLDVFRKLFRKNELSLWQPISRTSPGFTHHFGELAFTSELKPRKQIDLTPYVTSSLNTYPKEEGNKFSTGQDTKLNGGLDGKIGITNNLTLDFTINPDFGQVEADPSVVNLTAYETFYVEKRPFFIEGNNITRFPLGFGDGDLSTEQLFYSRRIGRRPQGDPVLRDGEYIKMPDYTPILAAAKITGKTSGGWSVGVIESLTGEETANIDGNGISRTETVEPLTNYFVGRLQKDSKDGNTIFGVMMTSTDRQLAEGPLKYVLHKNGRSGAFDFKQYFGHKNYLFQINTAFSNVNGTKEAIALTQTSSTHLFQRPDATHLHYNQNLTSLSGEGGNLQFLKIGGNLNGLLAVMWKSPGLELNDVGYLRSTDEIFQVNWLGYKITKPKGIMRSGNLNINQWNVWNFNGTHLFSGGNFNGHLQFTNQWGFHTGFNIDSEALSPSQLRGGPAMILTGNKSFWYYLESDVRKKISLKYQEIHGRQDRLETTYNQYSPIIRYQPTNTLEFSFEPSLQVNKDELQYVGETSYAGEKRYLLGTVRQKSLSFSTRINVNIRPNLTLQYWGQPFLASGKYSNFKMVTNARASNYANRFHIYDARQISGPDASDNFQVDENRDGKSDYSFANPNFNFNEFLSNLVLRWEYVPGSTLYLVWSQHRSYQNTMGSFDFSHNFDNLYNNDKPNNMFLIKLSYRIAIH